MQAIEHTHVGYREDGVPIIKGTTMKVLQLVLEHVAWNQDAEELQQGHPDLSLAQIHSALAYYYDNRESMDARIEAQQREVEEILARVGTSPAQRRLSLLKASRT